MKERDVPFTSLSGEPIEPVYGPDQAPDLADIGVPGAYPFTRGVHESMYRSRLWTMRLFAGFGTASETNERFRYLLSQGQDGLSVAFDFPTLMGYDSDHERSLGEVGRCGVAISTLQDMERLFEEIPLGEVSTSMTINGPAAVLLAMYVAAADNQGADRRQLRGTVQNDILKEFQAQHAWLVPPEPALRIITDMFRWCAEEAPQWNTVSISGYHIREAGSTAAEELAFTLANGREYVRRGIAAGMDVDDFAPRLSFFFDAHLDFFEEIAKFRAARRIWAKLMREEFGAQDERSWKLRFHTQTAGVSLTAQQPENNIIRTTLEAMAGVLGGTQSLHTNSMDETFALPTEKAALIALRTQQVIAHESEVVHTADPLGGSWFVEAMTDRIEGQARAIFDEIEDLGGVVPAIEGGYFQRRIHRSARRYQAALESGEKQIVGVTCFTGEDGEAEETSIPTLQIPADLEPRQCERVAAFRAERDQSACEAALAEVRRRAQSSDGGNLMEAFVAAVHAHATVGEICDVLRAEFGVFHEPAVV